MNYNIDHCVKANSLKFFKVPRISSLSVMTVKPERFDGKLADLLAYLHILKSRITFILVTQTLFDLQHDVTSGIPETKSESFSCENRKTVT